MKNLIEKQQQEKLFPHLNFNGFEEGEILHFHEIMHSVAAIFQRPTADLMKEFDGFLWALEGYLMKDILYALRECIRRYDNFPTPHQIIEMISVVKGADLDRVIEIVFTKPI